MNTADLRLPPHSVEAEQSVLGGLLLQNDALDRIISIVNERDFYRSDHKAIWRQIVALIDAAKPADVITVAEALESRHQLDDIGGLAFLAALAMNTPSAANIRHYAEIVREKSQLRALLAAGDALQAAIHDPDGRTPAQLAAEAESALSAFGADRGTAEPETATAVMAEVLRHADDAADRRGLETGIADLDALTGGLEPGQLVVVAARPAVGKTAVALAIARHVARSGHHAAFFSLEMGKHELAARLLAAEARVPARCLRAGPDESQWPALTKAATAPGLDGLFLDDRPAASVAHVRARCRRLKRQGGLSLVVIDYLQLMTPADPRASRTEQVGSLSRGLKALAKELGVPVIALAQLNRASEARADKKPMLSDLRDSGEVEQDADMVLLLSRASTEGDILECCFAKNRQGPTGVFWLDFHAPTMTFRQRYGAPPEPAKPKHTQGFAE